MLIKTRDLVSIKTYMNRRENWGTCYLVERRTDRPARLCDTSSSFVPMYVYPHSKCHQRTHWSPLWAADLASNVFVFGFTNGKSWRSELIFLSEAEGDNYNAALVVVCQFYCPALGYYSGAGSQFSGIAGDAISCRHPFWIINISFKYIWFWLQTLCGEYLHYGQWICRWCSPIFPVSRDISPIWVRKASGVSAEDYWLYSCFVWWRLYLSAECLILR